MALLDQSQQAVEQHNRRTGVHAFHAEGEILIAQGPLRVMIADTTRKFRSPHKHFHRSLKCPKTTWSTNFAALWELLDDGGADIYEYLPLAFVQHARPDWLSVTSGPH